uniref:Orn/DAP/Arg decarboxylase 2 N-terminal domain-containing protein n=1 Tax=Arcella intermedia TaxID=1963864 RepID=A0A6B2L6A4_9EUKA
MRSLLLLGVNFDCSSRGEMEMVLKVGAAPPQIIFANPAKTIDSIQYAKSKGVHKMTFDNTSELTKILNTYPEAQLILRISASEDGTSLHSPSYKFGARQQEASQLIAQCARRKANLIGISFHVGSKGCSSATFTQTLQRAREMFNEAEEHGLRLTLLDIGGGFPGDMEGSISFAKIASDIGPVIDTLFPEPHIQVIAEPGRYFCTTTMNVAMQVYSKRDYTSKRVDPQTNECQLLKEIQYFCPDGVYGNFNNILFDEANPICRPLVEAPEGSVLYRSTFFGPTCDSFDVIANNVMFPQLELGDWVYFTNMGAYTSASGSCFNGIEKPPTFYKIMDQGLKSEYH